MEEWGIRDQTSLLPLLVPLTQFSNGYIRQNAHNGNDNDAHVEFAEDLPEGVGMCRSLNAQTGHSEVGQTGEGIRAECVWQVLPVAQPDVGDNGSDKDNQRIPRGGQVAATDAQRLIPLWIDCHSLQQLWKSGMDELPIGIIKDTQTYLQQQQEDNRTRSHYQIPHVGFVDPRAERAHRADQSRHQVLDSQQDLDLRFYNQHGGGRGEGFDHWHRDELKDEAWSGVRRCESCVLGLLNAQLATGRGLALQRGAN